jgi:hypothetical protein
MLEGAQTLPARGEHRDQDRELLKEMDMGIGQGSTAEEVCNEVEPAKRKHRR